MYDWIALLLFGMWLRTKSKTLLNAGSSRSHAIYTLTLSHRVNNETVASMFQVVDLAGSERGYVDICAIPIMIYCSFYSIFIIETALKATQASKKKRTILTVR